VSGTLYDGDAGLLSGTTGAVDLGSTLAPAGVTGIASGTGTGQHGVLPLTGGSMGNAFQSLWGWLNKPFQTPMAPTDLFLLVGVVLIAILAWNMILYHVRIAAEAI
jgi:hypothetical protein